MGDTGKVESLRKPSPYSRKIGKSSASVRSWSAQRFRSVRYRATGPSDSIEDVNSTIEVDLETGRTDESARSMSDNHSQPRLDNTTEASACDLEDNAHCYASLMERIKSDVTRAVETIEATSRASFWADWKVREFLSEYGVSPEELGQVIAITGDCTDAQMTSVDCYLSQIWPEYAHSLLQSVQKALLGNKSLGNHGKGMFSNTRLSFFLSLSPLPLPLLSPSRNRSRFLHNMRMLTYQGPQKSQQT